MPRSRGLYLALGSTGALLAATPLAVLAEQFGWRNVFFGGAVVSLLSSAVVLVWGRNAPSVKETSAEAQTGTFGDIFRSLRFWRIAFLNFAIVGSLFAYQGLWAGPFLKHVLDLPSVTVGNLLLVLSGGVTAGYLVAGFLADRLGLVRGDGVRRYGFYARSRNACPVQRNLGRAGVLPCLFAGFGFSAAFAVLMFAQVRASFPLKLTGRAVTAVNLFGIGGECRAPVGLGGAYRQLSPDGARCLSSRSLQRGVSGDGAALSSRPPFLPAPAQGRRVVLRLEPQHLPVNSQHTRRAR